MHKNAISYVADYVPTPILGALMRLIVTQCYNRNKYNEVYRTQKELTSFEHSTINTYLKKLSSNRPCILDIGCGAGMPFDAYFSHHGCEIVGIDISSAQINKAKINVPSAKFINADFMSYQDTMLYDGAVLFYSLFHIQREYHPDVMRKIYNLLTPQGKVLLNIRKEDCGKLKYRKNFCGKPMCWSHYDSNTFLEIVNHIGFSYEIIGDEKFFGSSESHLWLILSKS